MNQNVIRMKKDIDKFDYKFDEMHSTKTINDVVDELARQKKYIQDYLADYVSNTLTTIDDAYEMLNEDNKKLIADLIDKYNALYGKSDILATDMLVYLITFQNKICVNAKYITCAYNLDEMLPCVDVDDVFLKFVKDLNKIFKTNNSKLRRRYNDDGYRGAIGNIYLVDDFKFDKHYINQHNDNIVLVGENYNLELNKENNVVNVIYHKGSPFKAILCETYDCEKGTHRIEIAYSLY